MSPARLYIYGLISRFLPETSCFKFKRALLRWAGARIGEGVRCCSSVRILGAGELSIGQDTWLGHDVLIVCSSAVKIGANVDIAPRVYLGTGTHVIDFVGLRSAGRGISHAVFISDGAWIGACAVILPGVTVGERAVVGAGSLVTRDVQSLTLAFGVPAKEVRKLTLES
jgi:acetyltransferase-like isoleucine patch superfamily enzyme